MSEQTPASSVNTVTALPSVSAGVIAPVRPPAPVRSPNVGASASVKSPPEMPRLPGLVRGIARRLNDLGLRW